MLTFNSCLLLIVPPPSLIIPPLASGYSVERIDSSPDQIISAAIMAGFLPLAETGAETEEINTQLEGMWGDGV